MKELNERISKLEKEIKEQEKINIALYKSIPLPSKEDPKNLKAEAILKEWREGSKKVSDLLKEVSELSKLRGELTIQKRQQEENKEEKTFVNSYGEATKREITTTTYINYQKRLDKQMLSFIGAR